MGEFSNGRVSLLSAGSQGGRILQRTEADEVPYFFMERLMQVGMAGEEIKASSCLQMLLHSEFINTVLQVRKKVLSAA